MPQITFKSFVLGEMVKRSYAPAEMALKLGMSRAKFYSLLKNPMALRLDELVALQKITATPYAELIELARRG